MKISHASLILLATMVAFGCEPKALQLKAAGEPQLPAGWTMANDGESGVSIAIAQGWRVGIPRNEVSIPGMDSMGGEGVGANESAILKEFSQQENKQEQEALERLREKGIVLNLVDNSRPLPGELYTRYQVEVREAPRNLTLEDAVAYERGKMTGEDAGAAVELAVGKAWPLIADGKNRIGDQETHISYVLVDRKKQFTIRFIATNNSTAVSQIEAAVADSFRYKPN